MYDEQSEYWRGVRNYHARQLWAGLLASHPWDAFLTTTSKDASLRKHPLSLLQSVRRVLTGRALDKWVVSRCFIAAEQFKLGDWHCHGVVKWDNISPGLVGLDTLATIRGRLSEIGFSRCDSIKSASDVAVYVSKYVIKDSPWEYDIWGTGWGLDKKPGLI